MERRLHDDRTNLRPTNAMNTELHHAIELAQQALQRIASLTRHHDACQNIHGCPDHRQHDKGRDHRCYACWRYKRTHGVDTAT